MTTDTQLKYDLEMRTEKFGGQVILFCKTIPENAITRSLINQLVKSSTSIGANYMEANGSSSRKDFRNKIYICKKESQETKHWLKMITLYDKSRDQEIRILWRECQELTLIFGKILSSLNHSKFNQNS